MALQDTHNNGTERAIRGPVVGRKNHYGSKSRRGTQVSSIFYSLVETAKLHDVDPAAYLRAAILAADRGEILLAVAAAEVAVRGLRDRPLNEGSSPPLPP